jgi:hypothetical protein
MEKHTHQIPSLTTFLSVIDPPLRRELAKKLCDGLYSRNSIRLESSQWTLRDYLKVVWSTCEVTREQSVLMVALIELEDSF